jgi:hypothetical protein
VRPRRSMMAPIFLAGYAFAEASAGRGWPESAPGPRNSLSEIPGTVQPADDSGYAGIGAANEADRDRLLQVLCCALRTRAPTGRGKPCGKMVPLRYLSGTEALDA